MKIAALYDTHGNLPALEAVLAEISGEDFDAIVIGGDVIPGPLPSETIARLRGIDQPLYCLQGNGEREILAMRAGIHTGTVPARFREVMQWAVDALTDADARWIAQWGRTFTLAMPGVGEVLFCHATPRNDTEIFTRVTPDDVLRPIFDHLGVSLVVCGHTHMPFVRQIGPTRVINAGSVGMPYGEPGAYWLALGSDIELRRTTYDLDRAAARIAASAYPHAEQFAQQHVRQPPSVEQMLEAFSKVQLQS